MKTSGTSTTVTTADNRSPSAVVIDLLARVEGTDPLNLDPLYNTVDPDALDALCNSGSGFESIEFVYGDHLATVSAIETGLEVTVEPDYAPAQEPSGVRSADPESSL